MVKIAFGYPTAVARVEWRPPRPEYHSRAELTRVLDFLAANGADAWWYSVEGQVTPAFSSAEMPHAQPPDMTPDGSDPKLLPWLVKEAHKRGIALMSWVYLNAKQPIASEHPEWRMRWLDEAASPPNDRYMCLNSPYGPMLRRYAQEIVGRLGFDGIWFDGCYQASNKERPDGSLPWGCCCDFCAERLARETGLTMPHRADWGDVNFRRYLVWRAQWWTDYWKQMADDVRAANPRAIVAYNYHYRFHWGPACGIALEHRPMEAIIGSEVDRRPQKLLLEMKYMRAVSPNYPPEMWCHAKDAVWPFVAAPNPHMEAAGIVYHGYACMAGGGFPSVGMNSLTDKPELIAALSRQLGRRRRWVGGQPLRHLAQVVSHRTLLFGRHELARDTWSTRGQSSALHVWQSLHGMGYMLDSLHMPSEALLDNQLAPGGLKDFRGIVMSDVACVSAQAAGALEEYVRGGGVLVITGRTGMLDELGMPLAAWRFDAMLGVRARGEQAGPCVLRELDASLAGAGELPEEFLVSGEGRPVSVGGEARVLARGRAYPPGCNYRSADVPTPRAGDPDAAIVERQVGRGWIVFIAPDVGGVYAQSPNRRTRELMRIVLERHIERPYAVQAPLSVAITPWRQGNDLVFHVLNQHAWMQQMLTEGELGIYCPEDVPATGPVTISIAGRCRSARCVTGAKLRRKVGGGRIELTLPMLQQHEIIVLRDFETAQSGEVAK